MLPPDEFFLANVQPLDISGTPNLREKEMILTALRFYFGPAQGWGSVRDVSDTNSLNQLNVSLRQPGERYALLEEQTALPSGFFAAAHPATDQLRLYAVKRDNPGLMPSFSLYEARFNLTMYIGPDFLHNIPSHVVINTLVLDNTHRPIESYTMRFD